MGELAAAGLGVAGIAALALLAWLAGSAVLWRDAGAIEATQEQKFELEAEVAGLRANQDGLEKAGMLGKLIQCGPRLRPCIRVNEDAGSFEADGYNDYRVIQGY